MRWGEEGGGTSLKGEQDQLPVLVRIGLPARHSLSGLHRNRAKLMLSVLICSHHRFSLQEKPHTVHSILPLMGPCCLAGEKQIVSSICTCLSPHITPQSCDLVARITATPPPDDFLPSCQEK